MVPAWMVMVDAASTLLAYGLCYLFIRLGREDAARIMYWTFWFGCGFLLFDAIANTPF